MHLKDREGAMSPGPVYMSSSQMTNYLQDLRSNRPVRPTGSVRGSRPPPAHFNMWSSRSSAKFSDSPVISPPSQPTGEEAEAKVEVPPRPPTSADPKSHRRTDSNMSIGEVLSSAGRPLVRPPRGRDMSTSATATERTPSVQYRVSGRRQVEKDEARALRVAMEELDLKAEQGLYEAARDEAAELVWKHQNPDPPGANPDAPYTYPGLARKGSVQRSQSLDRSEGDLQRANSKLRRKRNSMQSIGSAASGSRSSSRQSRRAGSGSSLTANATFSTSPTKAGFDDKAKDSAALPKVSSIPSTSHRKVSDPNQRRRSSSSRRKASASLFKNPDDQIYEEPEEDQAPPPAVTNPPAPAKLPLGIRRNPFARVQLSKDHNLARANTDPIMSTRRFDRFEIQRNPPSQSRNAGYTKNAPLPRTSEDGKSDAENEPEVKMKDGKEIRSDELRAATGFKLKDRSTKLPTPTMVSDSPGRPIVSFKTDWKPKEIELKEEISALPGVTPRPLGQATRGPRPLSKAVTEPLVPTLSTPAETPENTEAPTLGPTPKIGVSAIPATSSTRVNRAQVPAINIFEDPPARPLPSTTSSRKVNTPPENVAAPVPTVNVPQALPARSKPSSAPPIPTIAVQGTPSNSVVAGGGRFSLKNRKLPSMSDTSIPSISISESPIPARGVQSSNTPPIPTISVSESPAPNRGPKVNAPPVPTISVSDSPMPLRNFKDKSNPTFSVTPSIPTIAVSESPVSARGAKVNAPSINVNVPSTSTRPLPIPAKAKSPFNRTNPPATSRSHWTPTTPRTGALCEQCALPIAGRIVSAAGVRFHPECFVCHHCGEHLECVAFYPEPANKHDERVSRIQARQRGEDLPMLDSHPTYEDMQRLEAEDGPDTSLRFYCHLDFHELFSPRCKSCKTPIEGEVVVACGAEWHVGHFFCAQCGDPFDSSTPFVEKEGYAWCVGCHTNRYSTKCRKCRKPVTDTVVKALGSEWHVGCFVCVECNGPFEDGRYFLRGESEDPVCVRCEERRLKA
ncbi:hypothetical protein BU23DRAFT_540865 [Bimuria novae-zelandiae CBS 107.79]|uniref:LIM zinc-binding domain-containing protein n=1 Tax=Bimuria novae-zelandiae CBS 107.79 TaxID=1447943 RepID=A0A6A5UXT0_9PLEO|nr:hypothetical protein BU23DRAFT_540865 [Bimuria novae-zelandiae CBS 107.79]